MFPKEFVKLLDETVRTYDQRVEREGIQLNPNDRLDNLTTELSRACLAAGYTQQQIEGFVPQGKAMSAGAGETGLTENRHGWGHNPDNRQE